MIILITGASHTGKTLLAQKLLERYYYPVLSLDLLKMGLIRSGQTDLTPEDDELLVPYVWGIAKEIIKTAIENRQNLIVEGCYIPFTWQNDFEPEYLSEIAFCCLVMTRDYLETHGDDLVRFGNVIEQRLFEEIDIEALIQENERNLAMCQALGLSVQVIDDVYDVDSPVIAPLSCDDFEKATQLFCETVHKINACDYSDEQLDVWAPQNKAYSKMIASKLADQQVIGVKECGILLGFGSLDEAGDIDMLYVHKDRQRQGIATMILDKLERIAADRGKQSISVFASITAKPFFESHGYALEYENEVVKQGVSLTNYCMKKQLV